MNVLTSLPTEAVSAKADQKSHKIRRNMRVVGEIPHPECKITIFHWNNRYLIKLEAGPFEQTFKINDYDLTSEGDLKKILSDDFIGQAIARFSDMSRSLAEATDEI